MNPVWHAAARSDVGLVRSSNQDSGYAGDRFIVVADGMGGHAGGDVASAVAVAELIGIDGEPPGDHAPQRLAGAVARAQEALLRRVAVEPALAGMGTTVTAVLRDGDRLVLAHLGDSRAYVLHDGALEQVTRDHTFVQRLVDEGRITQEEAEHHPQRNVILRVLGDVQSSPEPDLSVRSAEIGDRWLLCSDGLPRVVSDETIGRTLREVDDVGDCADLLVQYALRAGAPDNVTCIVADVLAGGDDDGAAADELAVAPAEPARQVVGAAGARTPRSERMPTSPAMRAAVLGRSPADASAPTVPVGAPVALAEPPLHSADPADDVRPDDVRADNVRADGDAPPGGVRRARWGLRLLVLLAVAAVLGGGALAGSAWLGRQYYVADDSGRVAIYRGLSQDVGPIGLSSLESSTDLAVSDLPEPYQRRIDETMTAGSLAEAEQIVERLRGVARTSVDAAPGTATAVTPSATPSASPTALPTETPTATAVAP